MATVYKRKGRRNWLIGYTDERGKPRERSSGTTERKAAELIARKLEADAVLIRKGFATHAQAERRAADAIPPDRHLAEYLDWCKAKGQSDLHRANKRSAIERYLDSAGIAKLSAIDATSIGAHLRDLTVKRTRRTRKANQRTGDPGEVKILTEPASTRTRNAHRAAIGGFLNWCRRTGRIEANPIAMVPIGDERRDRKLVRRALTEDELSRLLSVARDADAKVGGKGGVRGRRELWYLLAALSGLRRGDLLRLRWSDVDLAEGIAVIRDGKAKREDAIPLHPQVIEALRERWPKLVVGTPTGKVFPEQVAHATRRRDFAAAGIKPDAEGRVADLHALRSTLATSLAKSGTPLQVTQRIMRHSSYRTTERHYVALKLTDTRGAVEGLPRIEPNRPKREETRATGTDGASDHPPTAVKTPVILARNGASGRVSSRSAQSVFGDDGSAQTPTGARVRVAMRDAAEVERKGLEPSTPSLQS